MIIPYVDTTGLLAGGVWGCGGGGQGGGGGVSVPGQCETCQAFTFLFYFGQVWSIPNVYHSKRDLQAPRIWNCCVRPDAWQTKGKRLADTARTGRTWRTYGRTLQKDITLHVISLAAVGVKRHSPSHEIKSSHEENNTSLICASICADLLQ